MPAKPNEKVRAGKKSTEGVKKMLSEVATEKKKEGTRGSTDFKREE